MLKATLISGIKYVLTRGGISCLVLTLFLFGMVSKGETADSKEPQKAVQPGPKLSIPEPNFDFGEVLAGEKALHKFKIRNIGSEILYVKGVKTG